MKVIDRDTTIVFDVDETLVMWVPQGEAAPENSYELNYYGMIQYATVHLGHVELLQASLVRGRNVVVWSGNGFAWAKEVIDMLVEEKYLVNTENLIIMSKPISYVDDVECSKWMGQHIYFKPKEQA